MPQLRCDGNWHLAAFAYISCFCHVMSFRRRHFATVDCADGLVPTKRPVSCEQARFWLASPRYDVVNPGNTSSSVASHSFRKAGHQAVVCWYAHRVQEISHPGGVAKPLIRLTLHTRDARCKFYPCTVAYRANDFHTKRTTTLTMYLYSRHNFTIPALNSSIPYHSQYLKLLKSYT